MSVRPTIASLLAALTLAGCAPSSPKEKSEALPWEQALAKKAGANAPASPPGAAPGATAKATGEAPAPAAPTTADGLRLHARQLAGRNDMAGALEAAEESLKKEPESRESEFLIAAMAQQRSMELLQGKDRKEADRLIMRSAELMRALHKQTGGKIGRGEQGLLQMAVYNEACSYALSGDAERALTSLREAFLDFGATNFDHLDNDEDLVSLRKLPAFAELKEQVAAKKAELDKANLAKAKEEARKALAENKPFAFDFTLANLEGDKVSLEDFSGKIRIVDLWGTWCPPCAIEVPHFVALQTKYGDRGLQVLGINYEREDLSKEEAKEKIKEFSERVGINYPCMIGDEATRSKVPEFNAYPTTLFIDRNGKIRAKTVGYKPLAMIEAIVTTLLDDGGETAKQ
jgi:thiol-disulfide isomerase/thioredoxin